MKNTFNFVKPILTFSLFIHLYSCNSNSAYDKQVGKNLNLYNLSSLEIISKLDTILKRKFNEKLDTNFNGVITLYSREENLKYGILNDKNLQLPSTLTLCTKTQIEYIFIKKDSSIFFNIKNEKPSLTRFFRHFICYTPRGKKFNLDINEGYEFIKSKKISKELTYVIIRQGFD